MSHNLCIKGMLYCIVFLELVLNFENCSNVGLDWIKCTQDSRDKTLGPTVDPSELLGPPGSSLL